MSDAGTRPDTFVTRCAECLLFLTCVVVLPLLLYAWLWITSLGIEHRLNPTLDIYASAWSVCALVVAAFNARQAWMLMHNPRWQKFVLLLVISVAIFFTCPEFYY